MWLVTTVGFFSVVRKPEDIEQGTLTIRSRVRADLEALSKTMPGMGAISAKGGSDYPFRARAPRDAVASAFADMLANIEYSNFKEEVGRRQGGKRASVYGNVWSVLCELTKTVDAPTRRPDTISQHGPARAYGGVVTDGLDRILLRRPRGDFDGYVWTFPKGRSDAGETPEQTALREVREETGYHASITGRLVGDFATSASRTGFFLMQAIERVGDFDAAETAEIRWVDFAEAAELIAMTTNRKGRERDLSVLQAARKMMSSTGQAETR